MELIFLVLTIFFYIASFGIFFLTKLKEGQAANGYDVDWDNFRRKVPRWGIVTISLAAIFNVLFIYLT